MRKAEFMKIKVLLLLIFLVGSKLSAQSLVVTPSKYYAYSLYNFSKFVKWPDQHTKQDFKIAVIGSKSIYEELHKLTVNKKYGLQGIKVFYFKKYSEIGGFHHMVFLSNLQSGKIKWIKENSESQNTMFITERENMGASGSAISFFVSHSGRIEFELYKNNFAEQNLVLNTQLATLAGKNKN